MERYKIEPVPAPITATHELYEWKTDGIGPRWVSVEYFNSYDEAKRRMDQLTENWKADGNGLRHKGQLVLVVQSDGQALAQALNAANAQPYVEV